MVEAVTQAQRLGRDRLLEAPALPPRLADLGHQERQERAARGRAHVRRAVQAGRDRPGATSTWAAASGVDYDGSQTNFASSMNYTMQEYANDVVYALKEICDADDNVPHPSLVSESGRAITAHHSVLVVNVLGVTEFNTQRAQGAPQVGAAAGAQHVGDVPERLDEELARGVSRRRRVQGPGPAAVQPRAPLAREPRAVREPVLGDRARRSST